jgi:2-methylisocitrate lyase-like PEP mutase family enzyme
MSIASERIATFRSLHESGCFVIPNPWDVGSARILEAMGFKALATTSSGFAWSTGRRDNEVMLRDELVHARALSESVAIPVNLDFEDAFASGPELVAANIRLALDTGIAGVSIEDSTRNESNPLYDFSLALERVQAAREAIDDTRSGVLLTARTEGFIAGKPDLGETIRRLVAFGAAGADCLYAPGLRSLHDIGAVVDAVRPKPVNVLASSGFATREELAALGVRRVSVGGALARSAWTGFVAAARDIAQTGSFQSLDGAITGHELEKFFPSQARRA